MKTITQKLKTGLLLLLMIGFASMANAQSEKIAGDEGKQVITKGELEKTSPEKRNYILSNPETYQVVENDNATRIIGSEDVPAESGNLKVITREDFDKMPQEAKEFILKNKEHYYIIEKKENKEN